MFHSFFNNEDSKLGEGIDSNFFNSSLPRLVPKSNSKINNSFPITNKIFLQKKRNKSKEISRDLSREESKNINLYKILNQMRIINSFIDQQQENIINNKKKKFYFSHTSRCFICGKSGHHAKECPDKDREIVDKEKIYEKDKERIRDKYEDICEKCLQKDHGDKECPKEICFNCGKRGHNTHNCFNKKKSYKNDIVKCNNCHNFGHNSNDCLCKPNPVYIKNYSKVPLCNFCGSSKHYLCPSRNNEIYVIPEYKEYESNNSFNSISNCYNIIDNENFIVNRNSFDSLLKFFSIESKKSEKIELHLGILSDDIQKEDIKKMNFCCKCGNHHFSKECKKFKNKNNIIINDDFIFKLNDNLFHSKNPLKYEPYEKNEYKINHHNIRNDYYDEEDSSGESFNSIFMKKSESNSKNIDDV